MCGHTFSFDGLARCERHTAFRFAPAARKLSVQTVTASLAAPAIPTAIGPFEKNPPACKCPPPIRSFPNLSSLVPGNR